MLNTTGLSLQCIPEGTFKLCFQTPSNTKAYFSMHVFNSLFTEDIMYVWPEFLFPFKIKETRRKVVL